MQIGDQAFFYHSGCAVPGIAGICEVCSMPYPDETQFAASQEGFQPGAVSPYFDPQSSLDKPRWWLRDVRLVRKTRFVALADLRAQPELANMRLLARGSRLSISPIAPEEWQFITQHLMGPQ